MKTRIRQRMQLIGTACAALVFLGACGANDGTSKPSYAKAEAIYKQQCITCHGDRLEGKVGPETNLTKIGSKLTRDQLVTQIQEGTPGGIMGAFKGTLKPEEIEQLADWLSTKK